MDYINKLLLIINKLQEFEEYSVRNVMLEYQENRYQVIISVLDFGQRIEIKKNDEEYLIFIKGIVGLNQEGIVHQKNSLKIINMLNSLGKEEVERIVRYNRKNHFKGDKQNTIHVCNAGLFKKTEKDKKRQMDRILDRYNDYLSLSEHPEFDKSKYKRKAERLIHLLKRI